MEQNVRLHGDAQFIFSSLLLYKSSVVYIICASGLLRSIGVLTTGGILLSLVNRRDGMDGRYVGYNVRD
jgi:hypothetical protein